MWQIPRPATRSVEEVQAVLSGELLKLLAQESVTPQAAKAAGKIAPPPALKAGVSPSLAPAASSQALVTTAGEGEGPVRGDRW